jgi:archaetidylinositol phosphate synthase
LSRAILARSRKPKLRQEALCELVFRPLAQLVVLVLAPLRVPPPAVVLAGAACGVAGAVELARGDLLAAALLVQLKTLLDNADGQLARLTHRVTVFGRYLDAECDLLVNAALFAGLGIYLDAPVEAALGFFALTGVLSVNFNVERLARGVPASSDKSPLGRVYAVLYGWQDRLADRFFGRRPLVMVGTLAQLGMSTQLLVFGACVALDRPTAYLLLLALQVVLVALLLTRREIECQEVSFEHH